MWAKTFALFIVALFVASALAAPTPGDTPWVSKSPEARLKELKSMDHGGDTHNYAPNDPRANWGMNTDEQKQAHIDAAQKEVDEHKNKKTEPEQKKPTSPPPKVSRPVKGAKPQSKTKQLIKGAKKVYNKLKGR